MIATISIQLVLGFAVTYMIFFSIGLLVGYKIILRYLSRR